MKIQSAAATGGSGPARFLAPRFAVRRVHSFLAPLALMLATQGVLAQGTVNFSMTVPGVLSTRVYMPETNYPYWQKFGNTADQVPSGTQTYSGTLVSGSDFVVELWAAPGANQPEEFLSFSAQSPFRTGAAAGTIQGRIVSLGGVPADCPVATVQLRAWQSHWEGRSIPTWFHALQSPGVLLGKSPRFNVEAIGGGTNPPPNLVNLRSFSLMPNALDFPVTPFIFAQPQHQSVPLGGNASFTVGVSCPAYLNYVWQFNGRDLFSYDSPLYPYSFEFAYPPSIAAGGILSVSVTQDFFLGFPCTNVMQLTNVQLSQAGIYSLAVTNVSGSALGESPFAFSSNAVLTVGNPGLLSVSRDNASQVVLNWDGVFFLQSATNVNGPFTDLPGPVVFSPYTNTNAGPLFFRLRN